MTPIVNICGAEFAGFNINQRVSKVITGRLKDNIATTHAALSPDDWQNLVWDLESRRASTFRVDIGPDRPTLWLVIYGRSIQIVPQQELQDWTMIVGT